MMYLGKNAIGLNRTTALFPVRYSVRARESFREVTFENTSMTFDFDGMTLASGQSALGTFEYTNLKNITIKNLHCVAGTEFEAFLRGGTGTNAGQLETITFINCDMNGLNYNHFARDNANLTAVYGELDLSNARYITYMFLNDTSLTHIELKKNSVKLNLGLNSSPFDDETLVNISNALDGTVTGCTLSLLAAKKTRCGTLMGTVNDGEFIIDENGATSLQSFITNIKGWTLS